MPGHQKLIGLFQAYTSHEKVERSVALLQPRMQNELPIQLLPTISCGVRKVVILDGRVPHSILLELLTDEGLGTLVKGDKKKTAKQEETKQEVNL